jgi:hypothetical protein
VIGGDGDVGILRHSVEEFLHGGIQKLDGRDLAHSEIFQLGGVESGATDFTSQGVLVEMLENSVHAVKSGPGIARLGGQCIWIMRLTYVQEIERRVLFSESNFLEDSREIIMGVHEFVCVEAVIENRGGVQNGERNACVSRVSEALEERWEIESRNQRFKVDAVASQAFVELEEVAPIIFGGVDVFGARMRQESGEQVEVGRRGPGGVGPALFGLSQFTHDLGFSFNEAVVAATVEDDQQIVVPNNDAS